MAPIHSQNQNVVILPTEEDVAVDLAPYVSQLSQKAIFEKGSFFVALSGGTLTHTLRKLTESPSRWFIFWVDERVLPLDNPDSNYFRAWKDFLSKVPIPKQNIHPICNSSSSEAVAADYKFQLMNRVEQKVLPLSPTGFPQFDLMLLGIGADGHVASLFPNRTQRYNRYDCVTYINDSPKPPPMRITFTFPVINSAKHIAMVVTDKEKAGAVAITLENLQVRPTLPCSEVKPQVSLTWFLNKDAASKLSPQYNK
ncbi:putative 6-phosphogluconolactonase 4, chloroplastic [Sesamum angolense]|nr:putative 6-phosphogluconolactonase 4, chloroplastic [Sesamum angolense]